MAIDTAKDTIAITEAEKDLRAVIAHAQETKRPVTVRQDGGAAVVILDAAQYRKDLDERDLLRGILAGEDDIRAGRVHTMEEVETYLDTLLKEE